MLDSGRLKGSREEILKERWRKEFLKEVVKGGGKREGERESNVLERPWVMVRTVKHVCAGNHPKHCECPTQSTC